MESSTWRESECSSQQLVTTPDDFKPQALSLPTEALGIVEE